MEKLTGIILYGFAIATLISMIFTQELSFIS